VSQEETKRARNNLILSTVLLNLVVLFVVVALVVDKLGFNFGDVGNALTQENANLLIKPLGQVNIGSADALVPTTKSPAEMTKTDKALALINEKGYICMGCHQVDTKMVGPGYKEIAAKYQGDDKAVDMLAAKIKNGGSGTWGEVPMPPNPTVTDDDLKVILDWILTLESAKPASEEPSTGTASGMAVESMTADDKKQLATQPADATATAETTEKAANNETLSTDNAM